MAGRQDFWEFFDDFEGGAITQVSTAELPSPWKITDTSSAGTPTYVRGVDDGTTGGGAFGVFAATLEATSEVQNVCLSWGDVLQIDVQDRVVFECRIKTNGATMTSGSSLAFGLTGDRNDTIDTIAQAALFRVIGADSTTLVVCESDDGTTDKDDIATGLTLINAYKYFKIDMQDLTNVKFFMTDGNSKLVRVASGTTFDMSAYAGSLQPFFQIQKTATANTNGYVLDYCRITGRRVN